jgi:alpha-amylase
MGIGGAAARSRPGGRRSGWAAGRRAGRAARRPAVLAVLSALAAVLAGVAPALPATAAPPGARAVIVHLFEWKWTDVATECATVLGPKGYGGVQVSPPQEHIVLPSRNYPWWQRYQPISYQLQTRGGSRQQFADMVAACHAAGVRVYADAVINHTAGGWPAGTVGSAGSSFSHYDYPGTYQVQDFHHCGRNGNDDIVNYGDAFEVQNCELVDLADLATETDYVRGRLAAYLNDLTSLGVDGFRIDAAKHMPPGDIANIRSRLTGSPYLYQEVIFGAGEPVQPGQYAGNGDLLEFRYGTTIGSAFKGGQLASLQGLGSQSGWEPSSRALVFTDNHDTQRSGGGSILTYQDGQLYTLANVFQLAWPYGTPVVMSSYGFTDFDAGPPTDGGGSTRTVSCGNGWICEHRQRPIANMVGFRNAVGTAPVANWWSNGNNQVAFSRGSAGFVAVNREGGALSRTFSTGLPAGTYCDVVHGDVSGTTCTGPTVTVNSAGQATLAVAAMDAVAIHAGSRVTGGGGGTVPVTFNEFATTFFGQNVFVVGSIPALGNWSPAAAVPLSAATYPTWSATVGLPASTGFQYKYLKKNPDGTVTWESDPNRSFTTPASGAATLTDSWR